MDKTFSDFGIELPPGASGEVSLTCPQCSAQRKKKRAQCLSVHVEKGVWVCHHCGWRGGLSQGVQPNHTLHWRRPAYRRPEPLPATGLPEKMNQWLASRGITQEVLERNKITAQKVYMPQVEAEVWALAFPYYRGETLINTKYRDKDKHFRLEVGAERILYGLNDLEETTLVVEGEMDKLAVEVAGFQNGVSVPDGAPPPQTKDYSSKFEFLKADEAALRRVKTWIIAVDNDAPGQYLAEELSRRLGREKCKRVVWPEGCKDANEVLLKGGPEALADCIKNAQPYPIAGVLTVSHFSEDIDFLYAHGLEGGVSTGWPSLDEYYTVRPGELTVVTGIPNSGKSNWLDCLALNLAQQQGWRFGVFSPENQPVSHHMARMIEKWAGKPFNAEPPSRLSPSTLEMGKEWVHEHFYWILPDNDQDWTVDLVLDCARALVLRYGIKGLLLDPWNEFEHLRASNMTETEYISSVLKRIGQFARHHQVHVWIVAHPAKLFRGKNDQYPVPTLYDISGSANWRNKADNGLVIYRNFTDLDSNLVDIYIQKIRFREVGKLGVARLRFDPVLALYKEVELEQEPPPYEEEDRASMGGLSTS
ncbi:bifunctional DNA primase/helicase [Nitrosococcus wardiae]|uniref:Toprim domain-containing protein n=1 Tax=Nitrosococcus wardiae TaxID=1814290 RepID=A0A4P7BU50_9GAMM|nr:bifunctional DNA primase/helicase [Nitrosococcus wardiae]QBQ53391.1 toprim domain-containing protein [Nitrosococcus wardiae]